MLSRELRMNPQAKIEMNIDFKKYKKIEDRKLCPTKEVDAEHFMEPDLACFYIFYPKRFILDAENFQKVYNCVQHLCQLLNRGYQNIIPQVEQVLKESGFKIMENEKHWCCGGGMGIMHIEQTIEKIARIRVNDFQGELLTTYCPSCYHILKLFSRKEKIKPKLVDTFKLLTENRVE